MIKIIERYPLLSITVLVLLMLLPNLNSFQLSIMEARNFITAREMLSDDHWLLTTMNGLPRYEKPPLPTWITACFGFMFGMKSLFALRFPSVIMVCLVGIYTNLISRKLLDKKTQSLFNGLIVVTSLYVLVIIIEAPWDIYTHGFMLIAIYQLLKAYDSKGYSNLVFAILFMACSILSKGPISLYALLIPFLIAHNLVYKPNRKNLLKSGLVMVLGIIIGGCWFLYIRIADPESFMEIVTKETSRWSNYHVKPFYYYWNFFLQSGLWAILALMSLLYPYLKNKVSHKKAYQLSFYWTIIAVILLSLIPEKKSRYLMPVLIPLAINTGFYVEYLLRCFKTTKHKRDTMPAYFNFGLWGGIGVLFPGIGYWLLKDQLQDLWVYFLMASISLFSIGGVILFQLYKKDIKKVFYLSILLVLAIMSTAVPMGNSLLNQNKSYHTIASLKKEAMEQQIKVYVLDNTAPEMIWHYGEQLSFLKKEHDAYVFPEDTSFGILVNNQKNFDESALKQTYSIRKIETYDLNTYPLDSRKYRKRLVNDYYLFQKKQ